MKQLDEKTLRRVISEVVTPEFQTIHATLATHSQQLDAHTEEIKIIRVEHELLMDEIKVIHECLADLRPFKPKVDKLAEDMAEVKRGIKIIKAVVTGHSNQLDDHEHRLMHLEVI